VIGKAVTGAVHGTAPEYSYFQGCSGGGRQALMQAQRYPADYDGIWSANPAINWTKMVPAELEAFRAAAVAACDGADGLRDGVIGAFDSHEFDPAQLVGEPTADGVITEPDAEVMRKIWEGPEGPPASHCGSGCTQVPRAGATTSTSTGGA
jgi:hypothetical protein